MTPREVKDWIKEFLPKRDSRWWSLSFYGGILTLIVTEFPDLIPDQYEKTLMRIGVLLLGIGGKMGWSLAGQPAATTGPRMPGVEPGATYVEPIPTCEVCGLTWGTHDGQIHPFTPKGV